MAERATLARPYARAAFDYARGQNAFAAWSSALETAAGMTQDERVAALISNPNVKAGDLVDLLAAGAATADAGGTREHVLNFLRLLAANGRLSLLPEIAHQYEVLRADAEKVADIEVTSAVPLDETQRAKLAAALKTRFKRDVKMSAAVDPDLLGGAVVRYGDLIIDGSLKGRLARMQSELAH